MKRKSVEFIYRVISIVRNSFKEAILSLRCSLAPDCARDRVLWYKTSFKKFPFIRKEQIAKAYQESPLNPTWLIEIQREGYLLEAKLEPGRFEPTDEDHQDRCRIVKTSFLGLFPKLSVEPIKAEKWTKQDFMRAEKIHKQLDKIFKEEDL